MRVSARLLDDYADIAMPERMAHKRAAAVRAAAAAAAGTGALLLADAVPAPKPLLLTDGPDTSLAAGAAALAAGGAAGGAGAAAPGHGAPSLAGSLAAGAAGGWSAGGAGPAAAVDALVSSLTARAAPQGVTTESTDDFNRVKALAEKAATSSRAMIVRRTAAKVPKPKWHAPWKLMRVISGHLGWVRCAAVEPGNEWFVTGSADRTIKVWDLASGTLKVTLTGHVNTVRAVTVSPRHPYLFSCGDDRQVLCECAAGGGGGCCGAALQRRVVPHATPRDVRRLGFGDQQDRAPLPRPHAGRVRAVPASHP
jgi:hypothetical protein